MAIPVPLSSYKENSIYTEVLKKKLMLKLCDFL